MPARFTVHGQRMGHLPLFPSKKTVTTLDPRVEVLLRSAPRLDVPDGLRTRLFAAHARRERVAAPRRSLAWAGGLAAAAVLVITAPFFGRGGPSTHAVLASAGLPIRVVDDPTLGLHGDASLPGEMLFADGAEAP